MKVLLAEAHEHGAHSLKRELGPVSLVALGIGAIIGAGIFVLSGLGAHYAGPGLMLSFVLSGLGCAFAGLCYAEFAAMIPLAGSAYTYAYATLGELFAWIIGWDLTLEYAMGASTVSSGWSNHFIEFLKIFKINMPLWLAYDHWTGIRTAQDTVARQMATVAESRHRTGHPGVHAGGGRSQGCALARTGATGARSAERAALFSELRSASTCPAFVIALLITWILVVGIKESARFNATIVAIKVGGRAVRHHPGYQVRELLELGKRLAQLCALRVLGHRRRRGLHLLRVYRIRRGIDHRAGSQEPAAGSCRSASSFRWWSVRCCTLRWQAS